MLNGGACRTLILMYLLPRVIEVGGNSIVPICSAGLKYLMKKVFKNEIFYICRVLDYYFEVPTKRPIFEGLFTKTLSAKKP